MSFYVALIVFPAVIIWLVYRMVARSKRRQAYRTVAGAMGWSYLERDADLVAPFTQLPLFGTENPPPAENVLRGDFGGRPTTVFEFRYTTRSGENRGSFTQTVVHVQGSVTDMPAFELRPQILMDRVIKVFGYQDIDLPHRPEFSRMFVLRGPDEAAIRARFSDPVIDAFEALPSACAQGTGPDLFLYQMGVVLTPDAIPEMLTNASDLMRVFEATETIPPPLASPPRTEGAPPLPAAP